VDRTVAAFNDANQLVEAFTADSVETYSYDQAGHRTVREVTPAVASPGDSSIGLVAPQRVGRTEYAYTAAGNLATVDGPEVSVAYTYDGMDRAVAQTSTPAEAAVGGVGGSRTSVSVWDRMAVAADRDADGGWVTYLADVAGGIAGQVSGGDTGRDSGWALADAQGSLIGLAGIQGVTQTVTYDLWGTSGYATAGWDQVFAHASERYDGAVGLSVYYARAYDPATGTFTAPDPIGAALDHLASLNPYTYTDNNPATYVDILGYFPNPFKAIGNAVASGTKAVVNGVKAAGKWVAENPRQVVGIAVGVVVGAAAVGCAVATAGICGAALGPVAASVIGGAAGSAASYAVTGDNGKYSAKGFAKAVGIGAAGGLIGGPAGGKILSKVAPKAVTVLKNTATKVSVAAKGAVTKVVPIVKTGASKAYTAAKTATRATTTKVGAAAKSVANTTRTAVAHGKEWLKSLKTKAAAKFRVKEGIYSFRDTAKKRYVGQSGNIDRRLRQHVATGKVTAANARHASRKEVLGGKTTREIAEQLKLDRYKRRNIPVSNKRNPVGDARIGLLGPGYKRP
jgi:RHS repeat-associated protein